MIICHSIEHEALNVIKTVILRRTPYGAAKAGIQIQFCLIIDVK